MAATNFTPIQLYFSTTASAVPVAANLAQGELAINITDGKLYYEDNAGAVQVIATKGAGTIGGSTTQIQYNNAGALAGNAAMVFNNSTNVTTLTTLNLTNALGAIYGGTAQSTYTQGDFLYASASNTLAKLGIGANTYILTSTGSVPQWVAPSSIAVLTATNLAGGLAGSVPYQSALDTTTFLAIGTANRVMTSSGTAPQWVTSLTGLTGVSSSSITNTSLTSGRVVVSTTAGLQADDADLTFDGTTLSAGGYSTVGLTTLVKTVKIGDSSFNGVAVFAAATPAKLYMGTGTVTDVTSAISATNAIGAIASLGITPIAATNTGVTYTDAATLYIAGAPSAGTNITLTNPYSLYVAAGDAYFGGTVTAGTVNLTTLDLTNLEVTNIKAKDGTASITLANSTGVASFTANPVLSGGTANGVVYLNGSKSATSGSALTFDGTTVVINTTIGNSTSLSITGDYTAGNTATFIGVQRLGGAVAGSWSYSDTSGAIQFATTTNHALLFLQNNTERVRIGSTEVVFNDISADVDFRVESDTNAYALFVDGGNDAVGVGMVPLTTFGNRLSLEIGGATVANLSLQSAISETLYNFYLDGSGTAKYSTTGPAAFISFNNAVSNGWSFQAVTSGTANANIGAFTDVLALSPNGTIFNEGGADIDFRVESDSKTHMLFVDAGNNVVSIGTSDVPNWYDDSVLQSNTWALSQLLGADQAAYSSGSYQDAYGYTTNWKFKGNYPATMYSQTGDHTFFVTTSTRGAGNAIAWKNVLAMGDSIAVFNEDSNDIDFRVESDSSTHGLFMDAGQASVSVNTSSTAAFFNVQGSATRIVSQELGNSADQGTAQFNRIVKLCPSVSSNNKLIIPFTSQGSLNSTTVCRVIGHNAAYNTSTPLGFEITFAVGHLTAMYSLSYWGVGGNAVSAALNGQTVEITFTTAYNVAYSTSGGVFVTLEYMTNTLGYSIDVSGIVLN